MESCKCSKKIQKQVEGTIFFCGLVGFLFVLSFFGIAIRIYELDRKEILLNENLEHLTGEMHSEDEYHNFAIVKSANKLETVQIKQNKLISQVQVLEASLDSQEMRWARIKKVRDAIKSVSSGILPVDELTEISAAVVDRADEYDVKTSLVLAIMRQESNFKNNVVSAAGAQGLLQVMPATANDIKSWIGWKYYNWKRVDHNVRFGTLYLARMLHAFEDNERLAVASYNCGINCVSNVEAGIWKAYPVETADYIEKVDEWKRQFEEKGITW